MFKLTKILSAVFISFIFFLVGAGTVAAQIDPNLRTRLQTNPIVVDHNSLALFDQIPSAYLARARNIHVVFSDRSVGQNISESLDCMAGSSWSSNPTTCRQAFHDLTNWYWKTFTQADWDANRVPAEIRYTPSSSLYSRANIQYVFQQGTWSELTTHYLGTLFPQNIAANDIVTYQFSYLNILQTDNGNGINDANCGFFNTNSATRANCNAGIRDIHVGRIEALEQEYTNKAFIYWTTSLARGVGSEVGRVFNQNMRSYAQTNHKILFDFADIISYDTAGRPCYDDRDGVSYVRMREDQTPQGQSENYADDGQNYPAVCQQYTIEVDNGHLTLATAKIRTAKAYWILLAQIAGWVPGSVQPSATPAVTSTPTATRTPTPTTSQAPGDANADGRVDGADYVIWLNHYNQTTAEGSSDGDFNNSGRVDGADYVIWIANYS